MAEVLSYDFLLVVVREQNNDNTLCSVYGAVIMAHPL